MSFDSDPFFDPFFIHSILNREEIERRLPHAGVMSLLDKIIQADETTLTAQAVSYRDADNPLRVNGKITMVNGIEYAAQAMAVHGALVLEKKQEENKAELKSSQGYIATVRNIELNSPYFPEADPSSSAALLIKVKQLMSDQNGFTYQFDIHYEQQQLISGRITIFLI